MFRVEGMVEGVLQDDFSPKTVGITAGPTREYIDPVRFISNESTGTMGLSLTKVFLERGWKVVLILGPITSNDLDGIESNRLTVVNVLSTQEMYMQSFKYVENTDVFIMSAAVADFKPKQTFVHKIKKQQAITLELEKNVDIIQALVKKYKSRGVFFVAFALETQHAIQHARDKMNQKNVDMLVLNTIESDSNPFGDNALKIILLDSTNRTEYPKMPKKDVAEKIVEHIIRKL